MATARDRRLALVPVTQKEAIAFILRHHRHHLPQCGAKFCIGAAREDRVVAVVTVGWPVARLLHDGFTAEVTRLCTDGTVEAHNAASMLYAAAWRAWRAMGGRRLITYTLVDETGLSLVAAGWRALYQTKGHSWNRATRPRADKAPLCDKTLWEVTA